MLDRTVFTTISNYALLFFNAFIQEWVIFSSRIVEFVVLTDVIAFNSAIVVAAVHLLDSQFLSLDNLIELNNFFPRLSHLLLLLGDILLALLTEFKEFIVLNLDQVLILLYHVILAHIEILLKGIEFLFVGHFSFTLADGLHFGDLIIVFTGTSYLVLHPKDKRGLLGHESLAMLDDLKHLCPSLLSILRD